MTDQNELCEHCDGYGKIWNNADTTSGQFVDCEICQRHDRSTSPMTQKFNLDILAGEKERRANERLASLSNPLTFDASYEAIIGEVFGDDWDVMRLDIIGKPPQCRAVAYRPR